MSTIADTIFVQPCTNEVQESKMFLLGRVPNSFVARENVEGRPVVDEDNIIHTKDKTKAVSCSSKDIQDDQENPICTWNGSLTYWNYGGKNSKCSDWLKSPIDFWDNFFTNIENQLKKPEGITGKHMFFLVTHHTRLKDLILPFKPDKRQNRREQERSLWSQLYYSGNGRNRS